MCTVVDLKTVVVDTDTAPFVLVFPVAVVVAILVPPVPLAVRQLRQHCMPEHRSASMPHIELARRLPVQAAALAFGNCSHWLADIEAVAVAGRGL